MLVRTLSAAHRELVHMHALMHACMSASHTLTRHSAELNLLLVSSGRLALRGEDARYQSAQHVAQLMQNLVFEISDRRQSNSGVR